MSWKSRRRAAATWLGVIALALNALVPIHFAFDLASALAPAAKHRHQHGHSHEHGGHSLLALLTGHQGSDGNHDHGGKTHHHQHDCAVCSAVTALAGFAPAAPAMLSVPAAAKLPPMPPEVVGRTCSTPLAYRSRAPPAV